MSDEERYWLINAYPLDELVDVQNELYSLTDANITHVRERIQSLPIEFQRDMFHSVIAKLMGTKVLGRLVSSLPFDIEMRSTVETPFQLAYRMKDVDRIRSLCPLKCITLPEFSCSFFLDGLDGLPELASNEMLALICALRKTHVWWDDVIATERKWLRRLADEAVKYWDNLEPSVVLWMLGNFGTAEFLWGAEGMLSLPDAEPNGVMSQVWSLRNFRCLKVCEVLEFNFNYERNICEWPYAFWRDIDVSVHARGDVWLFGLRDACVARALFEGGNEIDSLLDLEWDVDHPGLEVLRIFLEYGLDVSWVDICQLVEPLCSHWFDCVEFLAVLFDAGANVDWIPKDKSRCPPLQKAVQIGREDVVRFLLSAGASVDGISEFRAPLLTARDSVIAAMLLEAGASQQYVDSRGRTAYQIARADNHKEICDLLARYSPCFLDE